jgi:hypothetical protein
MYPHLCIPRNETVQHRYFQNRIKMFCLSIPTMIYCICERFIYFQDLSVYFAAARHVDRSWEYINRSQTHKCRKWDWGRAIPFLGTHKLYCRYSANRHINVGNETEAAQFLFWEHINCIVGTVQTLFTAPPPPLYSRRFLSKILYEKCFPEYIAMWIPALKNQCLKVMFATINSMQKGSEYFTISKANTDASSLVSYKYP